MMYRVLSLKMPFDERLSYFLYFLLCVFLGLSSFSDSLFDIGKERAGPTLTVWRLVWVEKHFICYFLGDILELHKDKNYLVRLSTHNGEEWNDEANEEGQRGHQDGYREWGVELGGGRMKEKGDIVIRKSLKWSNFMRKQTEEDKEEAVCKSGLFLVLFI